MKPRSENASHPDSPISKLIAMVGQSAAMQVAAAFEAALIKRLELFRAESPDLSAIRVEVHNLAGISTTLGFDELTEIARKIEALLRQGAPVGEFMPELIARCDAAKRVLETLRGSSAAG